MLDCSNSLFVVQLFYSKDVGTRIIPQNSQHSVTWHGRVPIKLAADVQLTCVWRAA